MSIRTSSVSSIMSTFLEDGLAAGLWTWGSAGASVMSRVSESKPKRAGKSCPVGRSQAEKRPFYSQHVARAGLQAIGMPEARGDARPPKLSGLINFWGEGHDAERG